MVASRSLTDRIRRAVELAGITQSYIAKSLGISQPAVGQWLTGKKEPTEENLADLAKVTGVRLEWLSEGISPMRAVNPEQDRKDYSERTGWDFRLAPKDGGRDFGNANVWSFDPSLEVLVREVLQNTRDAALSPEKKVDVIFRIVTLADSDLADFKKALKWKLLVEHFEACKFGTQKFNTLIRDGLEQLEAKDELVILLIEDSGTAGLTGPERDKGNFMALCRNNLDSNKEGGAGAGGAFGLGKAVLWRASRLSTVLFCSNLAAPEGGKVTDRIFGRCELAWHQTSATDAFAGPGWFGSTAENGCAESYWENQTLAGDLFLGREGAGSGTTACILGFHDASADSQGKPLVLAQDIVKAAATNFYPALVADKLGVRVEVYDSGKEYRAGKPAFSKAVNPVEFVPSAVRMLQAYREDQTVDAFTDAEKEVVCREIVLTVPKRMREPNKHGEQEHRAILLIATADDDWQEAKHEKTNHMAYFRGPGMIVKSKSLAGICLGARPFHALLLCGRAAEFMTNDSGRAIQTGDNAAETFLRTAEPPSHNDWLMTPDLKSVYAIGCKTKLEKFLQEATNEVRRLVQPQPKDTGDGPDALKDLFRIGSDPSPKPEQPRVVSQHGRPDDANRWSVRATVRLKPRKTKLRLTPAVYFLAETGKGKPVEWLTLEAEKGCELDGLHLIVPPNTREIRFSGITDPSSHPIPAADSCVMVDIKKTLEVKEAQA